MLALATFLSCIALAFTFYNSLFIRTPRDGRLIEEKISVLLPMRNEEENVEQLLQSLSTQINVPNIEFIILDDQSTDKTFEIASVWQMRDSRFRVMSGSPLPDGWIGKTWALQQLFNDSHGEILISIDSDVRLSPSAIASSIASMGELSFFSPYPAQITTTFSQRLIQPLLQWSWLSSVPLRIAEKSGNPALAVANGQFFIARREALAKIDGYSTVSNQVLDDMELARALIKSGACGTAGNGSRIATCHMYSSWSEIKSGYGKSLWKAFGGRVGSVVAIALIAMTGIIPFLFALSGSALGVFGYLAIVLSRVVAGKLTSGRILDSALHPLSSALLIYLIIYSWRHRGQIQWKGRTV
jgi:cellulose synthase/poly-beta-1,6-N-acetylglucosamine synthase-like glycosyltransferase